MSNVGEDVQNDLGGPFRKGYDLVRKYLGDPDAPAGKKKVDQSWHDEMVRKANASFANDGTKKLSDRKPIGSSKVAKKKSTRKPLARKR